MGARARANTEVSGCRCIRALIRMVRQVQGFNTRPKYLLSIRTSLGLRADWYVASGRLKKAIICF